eukprot:403358235
MSTNENAGVSLIQQYKKCQKVNQEQLRQAKNIEDLVNIKIETIDKQLVNKDNTYNFHYDPLQFRQQIPLMGDRTFLINQAILQKSSQRQRYAPSLKEEKNLFSGNTTKRDYLQNFAHAGLDLEEFTASIDKNSQIKHEKNQMDSMVGTTIEIDRKQDNLQVESPAKDPVQILKSIFKKKEYKKRPLEANQIANKYRKLQLKEQQKVEQRMQMKLLNQKQFKEDQDDSKLYNDINMKISEHQYIAQQNQLHINHNKFGNFDMQKDELMESKFIRQPTPLEKDPRDNFSYSGLRDKFQQEKFQVYEKPESTQKPLGNKSPINYKSYYGAQLNQSPHQQTKNDCFSLKERLDNLRRMFDDEEQHMIMKDEIEKEVIDYDLKLPKELTSKRLKKDRLQSEDTSVNASEDEVEKEDLKQFLADKISQINKRMNHEHPNFDRDQRKSQKYKASNLCKIQAVKNYGYEKLEEHFKNRMNKTGVDMAFKNAILNQEKKQQRQITKENERQLESLAQHKRVTMTAPQRRRADTVECRAKTAKDKNYVFAQIMKIEKINKETDKKVQVKKEEIRNDDILKIIEDTKRQVKEEEERMDALEIVQKQQEQQYIQEFMQQQLMYSVNQHSKQTSSISPYKPFQEMKIDDNDATQQSMSNDQLEQAAFQRQMSAESEVRTQLLSREAQHPLVKQETNSILISEQNSDVSPITKAVPNPKQINNINGKIISSQQTLLRNTSSRSRRSVNKNELNQSNEYGVIFRPDNEYFTDSELLNSTQMIGAFKHTRQSSKALGEIKSAQKPQKLSNIKQTKPALINSQSFFKTFVTTKKLEFMRNGLDPIQEDAESKLSLYNFSPRRFNRYPRFTIFLRQNEKQGDSNKYVIQNTVSLNPQFLAYLMENQQHFQISNIKDVPNNQQIVEQAKEQGIIITNEKSKETQIIDPFEKVILIKGIDNSILTSFRTLRKQNNLISDTMKVIHNKFQPLKTKNSYFQMNEKSLFDKMPYPLTDNEEAIDVINARIFAQNYKLSSEIGVGQTVDSRENTQYDESKLNPQLMDNQDQNQVIVKNQIQHQIYMSPTNTSSRDRMKIFDDLNSNEMTTQRNVTTAHLESQLKSQASQNQIRREKSEENKIKSHIMRRHKYPNGKMSNNNHHQFQSPEQIRNEYFNSKKSTIQHESRLMTANQDSYVESQDDHTFSDIIQGQKYSSKVINQFGIPYQVSQEQHSLMIAANSPVYNTISWNGTFQIPSNEPPQKIRIHTKYKKNQNQLNSDLGTERQRTAGSPSKSPNSKEKKEIIILSKIDPTTQAFPLYSLETTILANQSSLNSMSLKKSNKNPFRSMPNRRQVKPQVQILNQQPQRLELESLENQMTGSLNNISQATFGERQAQTAKQSQRRHSQFDFKSSKIGGISNKAELSKSINQNLFKQHQVLPPLLQNQHSALQYNQTLQSINQQTNLKNGFNPVFNQLPMNNTSKIKQVIDDLYSKEKRYTKQYARDDLLQVQNPIFNLNKYQNLQSYTNVASKTEMRTQYPTGQAQIFGPNFLGIGNANQQYQSNGMNIRDESQEQQYQQQNRRSINNSGIRQQQVQFQQLQDVTMIPNQYDYMMNGDLTGSLQLTSTFKNQNFGDVIKAGGNKQ